MEPLVSIVVPAFCHEQYINYCLNSIIAQRYQNIELIVIDDCSTDRTFDILLNRKEELESRFSRVVLQRNVTNLGVVKTENKLVRLSQGKYIKSIASDDMLLDNAIEDLVNYFEQHQEYDIIFSNALYCSEDEEYPIKSIDSHKRAYEKIPCLDGNVMQALYENDFIQGPTVLFKRDTFEKYGLYDENLTIEDWEYWLRVAASGQIGYCDSITVGYRISGQSLSHFSKDADGRRRLWNMYQNQNKILKKYEKTEQINASQGYRCFYQKMLHEAIDLEEKSLQKEILESLKRKNIKIDIETKMKYVCYKLHILRAIQCIKRILGMKTVDAYKIKKR